MRGLRKFQTFLSIGGGVEKNERSAVLEEARNCNRLKRLMEAHKRYEEQLSAYATPRYKTAAEQQQEKMLKRGKLRAKDAIYRVMKERAGEAISFS